MMKYRCLIICLVLLVYDYSYAQVTKQGVSDIIERSPLSAAQLGFSLQGIDNDLYIGYRDRKRLTTASTIKLLTTLAATDILGYDYRFNTGIAYHGAIHGDTLHGDLIIKAAGDPTFGTFRGGMGMSIDSIVSYIQTTLHQSGISRITGDLYVDIGEFTGQGVSSKWLWEDLGNYYGSGSFPFNIHENTVFVSFVSTDRPKRRTQVGEVTPSIEGLEYDNYVSTSTIDGRDEAYIFGAPLQYRRSIRGTIPVRKKGFTIKGSMPNPPLDAGRIICNRLSDIFLSGGVVVGRYDKASQKIGEIYSNPLHTIAKKCNVRSINLYADALFQSIGKRRGDWSFSGGVKAIEEILASYGIAEQEYRIEDGSGLSPFSSMTTHAMTTAIARYVAKNPDCLAILPLVGKNADVKNVLRGTSIPGTLYIKSGSMSGVLGYAGVYIAPSGKKYAFDLVANQYAGTYRSTKKELEKVLTYFIKNIE